MFRTILKRIVLNNFSLRKRYISSLLQAGIILPHDDLNLDSALPVFAKTSNKEYCVGLVKDEQTPFEGYVKTRAYYPKYERFLKNNNISYSFYDIHSSDWLEKSEKFDVIIWHTGSSPSAKQEALQKVYTLEQLGKIVHPRFDELFKYEDKVLMHYNFKIHDLPIVETFVSNSYDDTFSYIKNCKYPIISKITTGSGSKGVKLLKSQKEARKLVNSIFSLKGAKTFWKYQNQKDYIYFQEFIEDITYDLRVIVVDDKLFGYYRYPNKGDYKASGAGNYEKREIPFEVLDIAWDVKQKYESTILAIDFVYSPGRHTHLIIEASIFFGVDTPEQLIVDGVAGTYIRKSKGKYEFEQGKYWVQELALKVFFDSISNT